MRTKIVDELQARHEREGTPAAEAIAETMRVFAERIHASGLTSAEGVADEAVVAFGLEHSALLCYLADLDQRRRDADTRPAAPRPGLRLVGGDPELDGLRTELAEVRARKISFPPARVIGRIGPQVSR